MQKWEYLFYDFIREKNYDEAELNKLGDAGWELAGILNFNTFKLILKRPKQ